MSPMESEERQEIVENKAYLERDFASQLAHNLFGERSGGCPKFMSSSVLYFKPGTVLADFSHSITTL